MGWREQRATLREKNPCDTQELNQNIKTMAQRIDLNTLTKSRLVELCESRGLSSSGTKAELVIRLS